jgi:hypothetical protein
MSDPIEDAVKLPSSPTPRDVVACLRGEASPQQKQLILAAIDEPNSQLNQWLKATEVWALAALPAGDRDMARPEQQIRQAESTARLNAVLEFIRQKRLANVLSDADLKRIVVAGGSGTAVPGSLTPSESLAAVGRIVQVISEFHPGLSEEFASFKSLRSR